jgi:hypothetical protein
MSETLYLPFLQRKSSYFNKKSLITEHNLIKNTLLANYIDNTLIEEY